MCESFRESYDAIRSSVVGASCPMGKVWDATSTRIIKLVLE